jgi:glycosyltransferase involved in cell wall biosynthesis
MAHKVTIIVPVKDEIAMFKHARENGFLGALKTWMAKSSIRHVIFVNDGSKDKTAAEARKEGFKVIDSDPRKRNMGKGQAIIAGVKQAHRNGSEICMVLDFDVFNLSVRKIERLVRDLVNSKHKMIIPEVAENFPRKRDGEPNSIPEITGERAFYTKCFDPVLKGTKRAQRFHSLMYRMGADRALQHLIADFGFSKVVFNTAEPYRGIGRRLQNKELHVVDKRIRHRDETARYLRLNRPTILDDPKTWKQKRNKLQKGLASLKKRHRHLR